MGRIDLSIHARTQIEKLTQENTIHYEEPLPTHYEEPLIKSSLARLWLESYRSVSL